MSSFDINLNSLFSITNDFSINSKISYKFNEEKFNQKRESKDIAFSLEGHYKIIPLHQINFSFAINNSFYNDKSENININFFSGYSYYFGELINNQLKEGNIKGVVYEDENNNNYYDNGEKIFSGIKIELKDKKEISNKNGFNFSNLPYSSYEISVDKKTLPKGYNITSSSSEIINLYEKNKSVNFSISNKIHLRGIVYRNKNRFGGLDSIKVILDNKYEVETDLDGTFSFRTELGKHTLKLDIASIPKNYSPFNGIIKNIDINNDNNNNLEFILYPIRTFKANILDTLRGSKLIINEIFNVKYIYNDKIIEKKIKTNDLGQLYIKDLDECYLEISHHRMKDSVKIKIEDYPKQIKSEIYLY